MAFGYPFISGLGGTGTAGMWSSDGTNLYYADAHIGAAGTAALPTYSFVGDTDTGIYSDVNNTVKFSTSGVLRTVLNTANFQSNTPGSFVLSLGAGSAATPTYSFNGDSDTGIYNHNTDTIGFAHGGVQHALSDSIKFSSITNGAWWLANAAGTAAAPTYNFRNDTDTGIYSSTADTLEFSMGGVKRYEMQSTSFASVTTGGFIVNRAAGSAAVPTYTFNGDNNTGLFSDTADTLQVSVGGTEDGTWNGTGLGIGTDPSAKLHVDQASTTGAVPVLTLDQGDVSEEFIRLIGTSTTDATQSLVDAADLTTPGSIVGWIKVYIQDDQVTGPITDGVYYVPFYSAPSA